MSVAQKPMLLIWGMNDQFVTPDYLAKFRVGFPQAQTVTLPNCGHFPQEEQSQAVTEAIAAFLKQPINVTA